MTASVTCVRLDEEVDAFVHRVSLDTSDETRPADEVPEGLRVGKPDQLGWGRWKIQSIADALWLTELEASIPVRLRPALRSLLTR